MSYIQMNRESTVFDFLAKNRHSALVLLFIIAKRAKRTVEHPDKRLEIGEAYIGDFATYGVSKQTYRTDKAFLKSTGQITLRTTNKGTIAKLVRMDLFNINSEQITTELTHELTHQQHTTNTQLTPNNNEKNEKNEKKKKTKLSPLPYAEIWRIANDLQIPIGYVVRKHQTIMDKVDHGDFPHSSVPLTLRNWLRGDLDKGYVKTVDDIGKLELQAYSPENQLKVQKALELQKAENL